MKGYTPGQFNKDISIETIKAQILMEIEFGSPSKKCKNYGICNMMPLRGESVIKPNLDKKSTGLVTIYENNHVEIDFFKYSLGSSTYLKFFQRNSFLIEEQFNFSRDKIEFSICEGEYLMIKSNNFIEIDFGDF